MSPAERAQAGNLASSHPPFKVFLQKIDMPAILVVAENTTDDQLRNLLWYLRIQVRSGNFKQLGLQPTSTVFGKPGYTSGILNIYRGPKCAREMYITSGTDPCGSSIHKAASYHWGDGNDPQADGADTITSEGHDTPVFDATDHFQTNAEAQRDPDGTRHQAAVARIRYALAQTAKQTKQKTDIRFFIEQPDTQLSAVSYQFEDVPGQQSFLRDFKTLEQDHLCSLGFQSIQLGLRDSPGTIYPLSCSPSK